MTSLPDGYQALVVGASGAIGAALVQALQSDARCGAVHGWSRRGNPAVDLTDEASIAAAAAALKPLLAADGRSAALHLVVCATGVLQVDGHAPEKRLADIDPTRLARALAINAIGPALLMKHLHPLLPSVGRSLFGVLSARVGSIGDNRSGGWYGYRASKAALNQLVRSAAIEIARRRPQAVLVALHPGTVRSPLSAPIIGDGSGREQAPLSPPQAARHLLDVLDALPTEGASGTFAAWDGAAIEW
ncbi:MAG: SDR family oxidoreductase [Rubrivivax sp.]